MGRRETSFAGTVHTERAQRRPGETDAGALDRAARRAIESGRDWRGPGRLTARAPSRRPGKPAEQAAIPSPTRHCRVSDVFGYRFCFVCGGNDYQDTAFTCGEAR